MQMMLSFYTGNYENIENISNTSITNSVIKNSRIVFLNSTPDSQDLSSA